MTRLESDQSLGFEEIDWRAVAYEWITDSLEDTWTQIERLARPLAPSEYDALTPCPGWTVKDVLSHLLGFELLLSGGEVPAFEGEMPSHVKNQIGELNEAFVQANRNLAGIEVLEKFSSVTKAALKRLRALDEEAWEKVGWSPEGEKPYFRFQETRIFDSWIHLQDIRDALLQPADDHGTGEEVVVNRFEGAVPYILGKKMMAPEGTLVQINLIGRLGRLLMFKIVDGRCVAVDMTEEQPVLEITTPVALFWRRCAGRIGAEAFLNASATDVRGDKAMAQAFSQAMPIVI